MEWRQGSIYTFTESVVSIGLAIDQYDLYDNSLKYILVYTYTYDSHSFNANCLETIPANEMAVVFLIMMELTWVNLSFIPYLQWLQHGLIT